MTMVLQRLQLARANAMLVASHHAPVVLQSVLVRISCGTRVLSTQSPGVAAVTHRSVAHRLHACPSNILSQSSTVAILPTFCRHIASRPARKNGTNKSSKHDHPEPSPTAATTTSTTEILTVDAKSKKLTKGAGKHSKELAEVKFDPAHFHFVPLGGSGEIGMNMNLYHYGGKWLMVDLGAMFGDDSTPIGVDVVMADPSFIEQQADKLAGLVITHGHEDHIGRFKKT
jgi:hypothetical protein